MNQLLTRAVSVLELIDIDWRSKFRSGALPATNIHIRIAAQMECQSYLFALF